MVNLVSEGFYCHALTRAPFSFSPLDNIRVMVIVWRGNIIRTGLCWIVWHSVHSQQHTYSSSFYRSNRLDLSCWDPYAVHRGGCIIVTWWSGSDGIQAWSWRLTGFLQCFDTVGSVIYNVLSGTFSLCTLHLYYLTRALSFLYHLVGACYIYSYCQWGPLNCSWCRGIRLLEHASKMADIITWWYKHMMLFYVC